MIKIPCPVCCGDGFFSPGDRHVENRKEVCTRCKGAGKVDPETGQRPETSSGAGVDGGLYAARFGQGASPPQAETPGLDREAVAQKMWERRRTALFGIQWSTAKEHLDKGMDTLIAQLAKDTYELTDDILAATAVSEPPPIVNTGSQVTPEVIARAICRGKGVNPDCKHQGPSIDGTVDGHWPMKTEYFGMPYENRWHYGWRNQLSAANEVYNLFAAASQPPTSRQGAGDRRTESEVFADGLAFMELHAEADEKADVEFFAELRRRSDGNNEHIRNLQSIGRRYDAEGICRKSIDAAIKALSEQYRTRVLPAQSGPAPVGDGGAIEALVHELICDCDRAVKQAGGSGQYETLFGHIVRKHFTRAALDSIPAVGGAGWRPIETAPKDGTPLLLSCADWPHAVMLGKPVPIKIGGWHRDANSWQIFGASWRPTHWMPLPAAPAQTARDGGE